MTAPTWFDSEEGGTRDDLDVDLHQTQSSIEEELPATLTQHPLQLTQQHLPSLTSPLAQQTSQLDRQTQQDSRQTQQESWKNFRDVKVQEIVDSKMKSEKRSYLVKFQAWVYEDDLQEYKDLITDYWEDLNTTSDWENEEDFVSRSSSRSSTNNNNDNNNNNEEYMLTSGKKRRSHSRASLERTPRKQLDASIRAQTTSATAGSTGLDVTTNEGDVAADIPLVLPSSGNLPESPSGDLPESPRSPMSPVIAPFDVDDGVADRILSRLGRNDSRRASMCSDRSITGADFDDAEDAITDVIGNKYDVIPDNRHDYNDDIVAPSSPSQQPKYVDDKYASASRQEDILAAKMLSGAEEEKGNESTNNVISTVDEMYRMDRENNNIEDSNGENMENASRSKIYNGEDEEADQSSFFDTEQTSTKKPSLVESIKTQQGQKRKLKSLDDIVRKISGAPVVTGSMFDEESDDRVNDDRMDDEGNESMEKRMRGDVNDEKVDDDVATAAGYYRSRSEFRIDDYRSSTQERTSERSAPHQRGERGARSLQALDRVLASHEGEEEASGEMGERSETNIKVEQDTQSPPPQHHHLPESSKSAPSLEQPDHAHHTGTRDRPHSRSGNVYWSAGKAFQKPAAGSSALCANKTPRSYQCSICGQRFDKEDLMLKHEQEHEALKCKNCELTFYSESKLKEHRITVHKARQKYHKCQYCSVLYSDRTVLERHERTHFTEVQTPQGTQLVYIERPTNAGQYPPLQHGGVPHGHIRMPSRGDHPQQVVYQAYNPMTGGTVFQPGFMQHGAMGAAMLQPGMVQPGAVQGMIRTSIVHPSGMVQQGLAPVQQPGMPYPGQHGSYPGQPGNYPVLQQYPGMKHPHAPPQKHQQQASASKRPGVGPPTLHQHPPMPGSHNQPHHYNVINPTAVLRTTPGVTEAAYAMSQRGAEAARRGSEDTQQEKHSRYPATEDKHSHHRLHSSEEEHHKSAFRSTLSRVSSPSTRENMKGYAAEDSKNRQGAEGEVTDQTQQGQHEHASRMYRHEKTLGDDSTDRMKEEQTSPTGYSKQYSDSTGQYGSDSMLKIPHVDREGEHQPTRSEVGEEMAHQNMMQGGGQEAERALVFVCSICRKSFGKKESFDHHLKTVHSDVIMSKGDVMLAKSDKRVGYTCNICHESFGTQEVYEAHLSSHVKQDFMCTFCGKVFDRRSTYDTHLRTHTNDRPFPCNICGRSFSLRTNLRRHSLIHTDVTPFRCNHCSKGFRRSDMLNAHLKQYHNPDKKPPGSPKKRDDDLKADGDNLMDSRAGHHHHEKGSRHSTPAGFKSAAHEGGEDELGHHHTMASSDSLRGSESFSMIGGTSSTPPRGVGEDGMYAHYPTEASTASSPAGHPHHSRGINGHHSQHHGHHHHHTSPHEQKPHHPHYPHPAKEYQLPPDTPLVEMASQQIVCSECGQGFPTKHQFEMHMEQHARGSSSRGGGGGISSAAMISSATGETIYKCDKCSRTFNRRVHYETHLQSHDGVKSHRCPYCARAFSMKGNLRRHIRIHTNEAPYECPICFQRFRRSDGLKGHIKRHEACGEGVPGDLIPSQASSMAQQQQQASIAQQQQQQTSTAQQQQ